MRSAANSALRNNRSFVPLCRAEKGWICLMILNSNILLEILYSIYSKYRAREERLRWNVFSVGVARFIMHVPL